MSFIAFLLFGVVVIAACLRLYNFFEGESLPGDWWREYGLSRADTRRLDAAAYGAASRSNVVVSLTTIPSRLPHIEATIKSLLDQTLPPAKIVLNVPDYSERERRGYDVPPQLATLSVVEVHRCDDLGPATKLIPTLRRCRPDDLIVVVDDDRIYPRTFLADLAAAAGSMPDAVVSCSGWRVPSDLTDRSTTIMSNLMKRPPAPVRGSRLSAPYRIDIFQGLAGYAVRPRFFPDASILSDFSGAPPAVKTVDDVWLSAHCAAAKYAVPVSQVAHAPWRRRRLYKATSLGIGNRGDGSVESRPNTIAMRHFRDRWLCAGSATGDA
jgi:hypothetical protein